MMCVVPTLQVCHIRPNILSKLHKLRFPAASAASKHSQHFLHFHNPSPLNTKCFHLCFIVLRLHNCLPLILPSFFLTLFVDHILDLLPMNLNKHICFKKSTTCLHDIIKEASLTLLKPRPTWRVLSNTKGYLFDTNFLNGIKLHRSPLMIILLLITINIHICWHMSYKQ